MHVGLIYPGYPPETHSWGIGTYTENLVWGLRKLGHQVSLFSRSLYRIRRDEVSYGANVYRIPTYASFFSEKMWRTFCGGHVLSDFRRRLSKTIDQIHSSDPIDIIECGDWGAEGLLLQGRSQKISMIIRCHTPGFISEKYNLNNVPYLSSLTKKLEKRFLKEGKYLSAPNKTIIEQIEGHIAISAKVWYAPHPIVFKEPVDSINNAKTDKSQLRLICVGRLEKRKGQHVLCKAIELLLREGFRIRTTFVGADTLVEEGKAYSDMLRETFPADVMRTVDFTGAVSREEAIEMCGKHHLAIVPSIYELFGYVAVEAMSKSLPVIASDVGGLKDIVKDGATGYLFPGGDAYQLSQRIIEFLKDPGKLQSMGSRAKEDVSRFEAKSVAQQFVEIYSEIIEEYKQRE